MPTPIFDTMRRAARKALKAMRDALKQFLQRQALALVARLRPPVQTPGALRIRIELPNRVPVPQAYKGLAGNRGDEEYVYLPEAPDRMLLPAQLSNLVLCLRLSGVDIALASHSLETPPVIGLTSWRDGCVLSLEAKRVLLDGGAMTRILSGRVVRQLPVPDALAGRSLDLETLFEPHAVELLHGGPDFRVGAPPPNALIDIAPRDPGLLIESGKPVILVLPILLAQGGVERNTIEIIAQLRDRYQFVVATTERLSPALGSLHRQMAETGAVIYDLGEIAANNRHLELLAALKSTFEPALVWICNGSPWLADHAEDIRRLFAYMPIVDQQVYDSEAGWIERYPEPGFQSFDRYIAINRRIEAAFIDRLGMSAARIDLIYPALASERFDPARQSDVDAMSRRREFGLPEDGPVFALVARLSPQKNPLAFIALANAAAANGFDGHFALFGDGPLAAECDALIARLELANISRIDDCNDMSRALPVIDSLVFSSRFEGLPVAMLEALAMGVPTFATDVGDIGIILKDHGAGLVFDGAEAAGDDYRQAFFDYAGGLPRFQAAARAQAAAVRERFAARTLAGQYAECFEAALRDFKVPGG